VRITAHLCDPLGSTLLDADDPLAAHVTRIWVNPAVYGVDRDDMGREGVWVFPVKIVEGVGGGVAVRVSGGPGLILLPAHS
jgi:hypothetical protein